MSTGSNICCWVLSLFLCLLASGMASSTDNSNSKNVTVPTATLSNGITIPLVGLGCASGVRKQHVLSALEVGYRYLDTAQAYQWGYHERDVADAIAASPHVTRQDVFVTTKVHPENLGYQTTQKMVQASLALPGFEGYLDAVLIHKPHCWPGACNKDPEGTWQDSWKVLEEYYDQGVIRAIGICDVNDDRLLNELLQQRIPPHIIQNWMDPFHQEPNMQQKIQSHNILYQAYSTLGTQWKHFKGLDQNPVLTSPQLLDMARRYSDTASPAQVVLQWATRKGISVLPASTNPQRQPLNLYGSFEFELAAEDLQLLDGMNGKAPKPNKPDPNQVSVTFRSRSTGVDAFWVNDGNDGEEVPIGIIQPDRELTLNSYHGHSFVFRSKSSGEVLRQHVVSRNDGKTQTLLVDADSSSDEDEEL